MSRKVHPAANLFPLMDDDSFNHLKADIEKNGQREMVVYWRDQLVDGRNRLRACRELKIQPSECELDDGDDPIAYVLSANLHRRHLDESQRATVAAKLKELLEPEKHENKRKGGGDKKSQNARTAKKSDVANLPQAMNSESRAPAARDQAAAMLNVSGRSVDHASAVLKQGSPELIAAVESGKVAVSKAAKIAKTTDKPKQLEAATTRAAKKRTEKTAFDRLCELWKKASDVQKSLFRDYIETNP